MNAASGKSLKVAQDGWNFRALLLPFNKEK